MACVQWLLLEPGVIRVRGTPDLTNPASTTTPLPFCFCFRLVWFSSDFGFVEVLPKLSFEKENFFGKMDAV